MLLVTRPTTEEKDQQRKKYVVGYKINCGIICCWLQDQQRNNNMLLVTRPTTERNIHQHYFMKRELIYLV